MTTAATYDNLPTLIQELKRAAIDAYMRTLPGGWKITAEGYQIKTSDTKTIVTRPGPDGEGGGDWSQDGNLFAFIVDGSKDEEFRGNFASIRSTIDATLERFLDLPDPVAIEEEVERMRQVRRRLSGTASNGDGGATGSGIIQGQLDLILQNTTAMSGSSIGAFKSRFVSQLGGTVAGHHILAIILGSVLAAEKGMWEDARTNVAELVAAARDAGNSIAESGASPDYRTVLKAAGWAFKGAGIFFPSAKPALEAAGLGVTILEGTVAAESTVINGADAEAVLTDLDRGLQKLVDQITAEEELLQENLVQNLGNVRNDQASYDLNAATIENDDPGDVIIINRDLVDEIVETYMPTIAAELSSIGSDLLSTSLLVLSRDSSIGIAHNGPGQSWYDLRYLLYELVANLSWDVETGGRNLNLVMREILGLDDSNGQDLDDLEAEIDGGSPHDPWNVVEYTPNRHGGI